MIFPFNCNNTFFFIYMRFFGYKESSRKFSVMNFFDGKFILFGTLGRSFFDFLSLVLKFISFFKRINKDLL